MHKETKPEAVIYNVKIKKRPWGRKEQDRKDAIKKRKPLVQNPKKLPKRPPIAPELLEKHSRGEGLNVKGVRTSVYKKKFEHREKDIKFANEFAASAEILLTEKSG